MSNQRYLVKIQEVFASMGDEAVLAAESLPFNIKPFRLDLNGRGLGNTRVECYVEEFLLPTTLEQVEAAREALLAWTVYKKRVANWKSRTLCQNAIAFWLVGKAFDAVVGDFDKNLNIDSWEPKKLFVISTSYGDAEWRVITDLPASRRFCWVVNPAASQPNRSVSGIFLNISVDISAGVMTLIEQSCVTIQQGTRILNLKAPLRQL